MGPLETRESPGAPNFCGSLGTARSAQIPMSSDDTLCLAGPLELPQGVFADWAGENQVTCKVVFCVILLSPVWIFIGGARTDFNLNC